MEKKTFKFKNAFEKVAAEPPKSGGVALLLFRISFMREKKVVHSLGTTFFSLQ
jgi:hypothetical protein